MTCVHVGCCTVLLKQGIGSPVTGQVFIVTADASKKLTDFAVFGMYMSW